jgi:hypothetical protein
MTAVADVSVQPGSPALDPRGVVKGAAVVSYS